MAFNGNPGWRPIAPNECALCGAVYASKDPARPGSRPLPPGEGATLQEMLLYQGELISYMADMVDYLANLLDKLFEQRERIAH